MVREIKWRIGDKIEEKVIIEIESQWSIKFPKEYVDIVMANDSSRPKVKDVNEEWQTGLIDIPGWETISFIFISFMEGEKTKEPMIKFMYDIYKDCFPEPDKIFPFAEDGGGNLLLLDYRKDEKEPAILFLDHGDAYTEEDFAEEDLKKRSLYELLDENFYRVADSFEEFLDMIYPDKE
ncbi:SMI1/KNR4 family protein [Clostridium sp. SHJSY1]|uniref:SMI1/KNR4 family protein n=1 Tax=Clostridium sp. SHJSY1 TaxID=2942483 RepID=UPI0028742131|nr:SMI1/KNR4 family protein [Clostridium sp. SHJSY1]MDS0527697.1 SMI1/KNR4 family protein [Clostridium sp. SHJSY1]